MYPIYTVMTIEFGNILSAININLNNFESRIESKHFKTSALECATFVSACTRVPTSVFEHTALFNLFDSIYTARLFEVMNHKFVFSICVLLGLIKVSSEFNKGMFFKNL